MENSRLVVLFGDSLLMDGVEASLRASQSLGVMRIQDGVADLRKCLRSLRPDMVIFDWDTPQAQLIVSVLRDQPGVTLLGLDIHSRKVIIVSSHQYTPLSASELVQVIQSQSFPKVRGVDPNSIVLGEWKTEFLH
jgi:hypothetical protein